MFRTERQLAGINRVFISQKSLLMNTYIHAHTRRAGFTLIELLVVISIIALLASLMQPGIQKAIARSQSIQCSSNLRQIGLAVMAAAQDNDNKYPKINDGAFMNPAYYPNDPDAKTLPDTLAPYGVSGKVLKCPSDNVYYAKYGCSYQWCPFSDDEQEQSQITLYLGGGQRIVQVPSARIRLAMDYSPLHNNHSNAVYADGHVTIK